MQTIGPLKISIDTNSAATLEVAQLINEKMVHTAELPASERFQAVQDLVHEGKGLREKGQLMHRPHVRARWDFMDTGDGRTRKVVDMMTGAVLSVLFPKPSLKNKEQTAGKASLSIGMRNDAFWLFGWTIDLIRNNNAFN